MRNNNIVSVSSGVFLIVGVVHGLRLIYRWDVQIGNFSAPMWASVVALMIASCLSFQNFRLAKRG